MQTKAKLEAEIAALAAEVQEVARRHGRSLPTASDWADLLEVMGVTWDELEAALAREESEVSVLPGFVTRGEVPPAAEPVREALLAAVLSKDRAAYYRTLRGLRSPLTRLLAPRAEQWAEEWEEANRLLDLSRGAKSWLAGAPAPPARAAGGAASPEDQLCAQVSRARGWPLAVLAGLALRLSAAELARWREWITEGALRRHAFLLGEGGAATPGCGEDPAELWQREAARHTLPEEEETELVRRGVVSAEALAVVKALAPIPARQTDQAKE